MVFENEIKQLRDVIKDFHSKTLDEIIFNGWVYVQTKSLESIALVTPALLVDSDYMTTHEWEESEKTLDSSGFVPVIEWQDLHILLEDFKGPISEKDVQLIVENIDYYFQNDAWPKANTGKN